MNIFQTAEVNFHEQDKVSVFLESNSSGREHKIAEIGLATFFALRMLANLDVNETSDLLAKFLIAAPEIVRVFAAGAGQGGITLVEYPGYQGRKQFKASLFLSDLERRFDVSFGGFDEMATGMGYYAPIAVQTLIRRIAEARSSDNEFLSALGVAASICGRMHLERRLTLENQGQLALMVIANACDEIPISSPSKTSDASNMGESEVAQAKTPADVRLSELLSDPTRAAHAKAVFWFYTIASPNGYRIVRSPQGNYIPFWFKRNLCLSFFEVQHDKDDKIETIEFEEVAGFVQSLRESGNTAVAGIVIDPELKSGGVQGRTFSPIQAVDMLIGLLEQCETEKVPDQIEPEKVGMLIKKILEQRE